MLLYFYLTDKAYNTFLCSEGCFGYFINVCENRIILLMMFQDTELLEKKTNIFSEKKKNPSNVTLYISSFRLPHGIGI